MSDLNVTSTSLTVAENSKATAIAIAAPTDVNSADSGLTVTVDELPTDGVVLLVDEVTPVTLGETLTVTQLTGLTFRPTTNAANLSSLFAFTVSDPAGNTASGAATLAIARSSSSNTQSAATAAVPAAPAGPRSDTPGDYNSVFGKALNIAVPSEAPSHSVTVQVTELPTNGRVVLSDGSTPVSVGKGLTPTQAAGLRFKPNGVAQSSHFGFAEVIPGRPPTPKTINLPFDSKTKTITPAATAMPATAAPATAASATEAPSNPNPIVLENEKPGTPQSVWQISPGQDSTKIQGFTTGISTPVGGAVHFKINNQTGNGTYSINIYRLGYYGGDGAALVTTLNHSGSPVVQPNPLVDSTTGEVDAGNWSVTDSWAVPANATSGVYVANVIDGSQIFQIPFVVTNPSSASNIVFQTSDETWQAYNGFGGANLYGGNGPANTGAAFAVSYNRPIVTRDSIGTFAGPQDSLFGAEYAAIYWLEENGYDVSYISGIDTATNGSLLLNHKVFMDAGHDEYWTDSQVANVQAAVNAGVNLAFLSGNEMFWQTRLSPSIDSTADANRTLVSYKDTHYNMEIDPSGHDTGTFEDPRFGRPPMPSNELTGTFFQVDDGAANHVIQVPYGDTQLRFWRNTSVANTAPGNTASLTDGLLGYEWDSSPDNGFMPAGLIDLSSSTYTEPTYNTDWGSVDATGTATHNLVEYRNPTSGALVFGAGTVFWSWGLSDQHDNSPYAGGAPDPNVQQAMVNLFADMGVQPQTLQASLVIASQSTDHTPPTSHISTVSSTNVVEGQTVTVAGTATDAGGGVIGGVQVSSDGGKTWHPASGQVGSASGNWTYSFTAPAAGTYAIESRAVDDSLNLETPGPGVSYNVAPSVALSLFSPGTAPPIGNDANAIEVGVKFTAATSGQIAGIRFYKGSKNTGTHVGNLWSASGTLLATATFSNETASGWQQVNFSSPVNITPGTTYIASYHTNTGDYADTPYYFATYQGQSDGSLNAPGDSLNGVFAYSASSTFPDTTSVTGDNFWVDVVFNDTGRLPPVLGNLAASASYSAGATATTLSPSTTVSDPGGSTNLVSGTVSIAAGLATGDALAATTTGTSITATYNAGVLSLSGSDTLAHYQQVLDSVSYSSSNQNPTNYGADPSRTLSWVVNDGTTSSATQTTTVNLTGGPATATLFSPSAAPGTITENDPSAVDLGVKFQASGNGSIIGIRFYKGPQNTGTHTGDLWTTSGTLLASANFSNETASGWQQVNFSSPVSITAGATYIASYETTVGEYSVDSNYFTNSVTNGPLTAPSSSASGGNGVYAYGSPNPFPNNTFSASNYWVDVVFSPSATQTPPVLGNVAASAAYTEAASPTTLSSGATVGDPESANLVSGTVSITGGFLTGDTLGASTTGTSITATYNAGVLNLSGSDTLAHYQQVLDSVSYSSTNQNPTNFGTDASRTVSWVVNDGTLNSAAQSTTVNITAVDNAPALSNVAASASYAAGATATTLSPAASASDVDNQNLASATVSITNGFLTGDTLAATITGTSITASYSASTGVLSLSGSDTLAHYQQVLDSVSYSSTNQNPTNSGADPGRSVSWVVNDGTLNSATQTTAVSISTDQPPALSNVAASAAYTEAASPTTLSSGATVGDPDSANLVSGTVSITGGLATGDALAATITGTSIIASYNASTGVLSLTGSDTLAHYQQVLDSVSYSSTSQNPTNFGADPGRTISWVVNDGTLNSAAQSTTVNITAVDNAPALSNVAASASYAAGATATTLSPAASASDVDNQNLASATVSITNGFLTGDTLAATITGTSITASYSASTGVLSLSGSDTLAHYQQVLDSVSYSSTNQNPTNSGADPNRTVSWVVNDGTLNSTTQITTVNLSGGPTTDTLFSPSATPGTITEDDPNAVDLGVKFQASAAGVITGIRFYKGPQNTGTHIGDLWTASGTLLASATFTNETASGWQQVNFSSPVSITAGATYIASYEAPVGEYSTDQNYFTNALTNGPLTAPSSSSSGGNGVYAYGSSNSFPNNTFSASNYWVDVVFSPGAVAQPSITTVALSGGLWQLSGSAAAASTVTVFDGATQLGTTTANSSGGWSFPTNENNSAIRDFTAAGNAGPASAAWFEGTTGADVFSFASEAALVAPAAIFGNSGSDTLDLTTPTTLADADFAHAHNILTLALTGASSVTLGTSAAAAGIANVTTGNAATSITDSNTGTLNVNAGALAAGTLLTLSGSEKFTVTGLQGNLAATNETGTLNVTTAAASALSIATGGGADTITASAMTQGATLTLTGSHAATVAVGGNLAASAYTGKLTVTASGTASQAITTGSGADSITAANGADTITAGAGADTIKVSGHTLADTFVYHAVGDSPNTSSGHDTITGFLAGTGTSAINDTLDFSAILGPTYSVQALGSTSTKVNPDSIAWLFNSSANQTLAYVNATGGALSQTSNKLMEVALVGNIHLAAANLIG
jgi:hypothetical protein